MEELQQPSSSKIYTEENMLEAFKHGRSYEDANIEGDIATKDLPAKNRPFWGWLRLKEEVWNTRSTPDIGIEWVGECDNSYCDDRFEEDEGVECSVCNGTGQITRQATLEEVIRVARSLTITANKKDWSCVQEFIEALDQALAINKGRLKIKE